MKRRSVYVPVTRLPGAPSPSVETTIRAVWCDPTPVGEPPGKAPPGVDKHVAPVIARLYDTGLYMFGCMAAMAVRKLGRPPPSLALWQRWHPHAWFETRRLDAADTISWEGQSAELGLALALLLPGAQFGGVVMASGSLTGETRELRDRDVAVHPVGHLEAKLRELLKHSTGIRRLSGGRGALCFTPPTDDQGRPVAELAVTGQLRERGIEVVPIGWLSEAVKRLGCGRAPFLPADLITLATILTLALGLVLGGAAWLWRDYPIPLAFERGGGQAAVREPYVACITADGRHTVPRSIPRQEQIPLLGTGQKLAWAVRAGRSDAWDARLLHTLRSEGYYLLFALVSADGRRVLADRAPAGGEASSAPYRVPAGETWEQWFQVPAELGEGEQALVILARRDRGFDPDALGRALDARAGSATGADAVYRAVNFLQSQAPGVLVYQFDRSGDGPDVCQP